MERLGIFLTSLDEVFVGAKDVRFTSVNGKGVEMPLRDERIASKEERNARSCDWGFDDEGGASCGAESVGVPVR